MIQAWGMAMGKELKANEELREYYIGLQKDLQKYSLSQDKVTYP